MLQPIGLYPFLTKALQFQKLTNFARLNHCSYLLYWKDCISNTVKPRKNGCQGLNILSGFLLAPRNLRIMALKEPCYIHNIQMSSRFGNTGALIS